LFSADAGAQGAATNRWARIGIQARQPRSGSAVFGGLAPFATAALLAATQTTWSVAGYITVLAAISITTIVLLRQLANDGAEQMA
jgi:hypothetical protein